MRSLLLALCLISTGCFYEYVYIRPEMPIIPLSQVDEPEIQPLADDLPQLSDDGRAAAEQLLTYALQLRAMIELYNEEAEAANARPVDPTP